MAVLKLTQAQWYSELKGLVPAWVLPADSGRIYALFMALAKTLELIQENIEDHIQDTFIKSSASTVLNTHGDERSINRVGSELDPQYEKRVRSLSNQSNPTDLKALVDQFLIIGQSQLLEEGFIFCDREFFCDRAALLLDDQYHNTFSVIIPNQYHNPYSFADREFFCDRENFMGASEFLDSIFSSIVRILNENKALGTAFRVIETEE